MNDSGPPRFDQRPGDLEATRPDPAIVVVGSRKSAREFDVLVLVTHGSQLIQVQLSPAQADKAARDLAEMAQVCRREHEVQEQRQAEKDACR